MSQESNPATPACILLAGFLSAFASGWGAFAVLGIGYSDPAAIVTDAIFVLPLIVFLFVLRSLRGGCIALWLLFLAEWIDRSLVSVPPALVNPFDWFPGILLFSTALLITVAVFLSNRQVSVDEG